MKVLQFSGLVLKLSKPTEVYYNQEAETMYVIDRGTVYQYKDIPLSAWLLIKSGDVDFFNQLTDVMPYKIVPRLPKSRLDMFVLPVATVVMWKVNSSNVEYLGYDSEKQRLYAQFKGGDTYVYYDVEPEIWNGLRQADSKGSFLHWFIKVNNYRYDKIGGFGLNYSTNYLTPNAGTEHPDGYLTGFAQE
jgi:hypothetical protein